MTARNRATKDPDRLHTLDLSLADIETLAQLANYYQKSMGVMRHMVRLTTAPNVRRRFRFVAQESAVLEQFISAVRHEQFAPGIPRASVAFTPAALVAFWGRLLSSLHSKRSRRKLSEAEIAHREQLAASFESTVRRLQQRSPELVEKHLLTRRVDEQSWMRSRLQEGPE